MRFRARWFGGALLALTCVSILACSDDQGTNAGDTGVRDGWSEVGDAALADGRGGELDAPSTDSTLVDATHTVVHDAALDHEVRGEVADGTWVDGSEVDDGADEASAPRDAVPDAVDADADVASGTVRVKIIGFNDFHGHIGNDTPGTVSMPAGDAGLEAGARVSVPAGGAGYFATHLAALKAQNPNHVVVSAGDLIGATPLVSGVFRDQPTIEVMNLVGLDIAGVGNHEFDDGTGELLRMQSGGCSPVEGCFGDAGAFAGAKFKFLAANVVVDPASGRTLFPRYEVREFDGVKLAFVGMTLEGTPSIVTPTFVSGLTFRDEADTVNELVPELRSQGVETIVVVLHEGGTQRSLDVDACTDPTGPIVDIVARLDPAVDLVISGHTHQAYNCLLDGRPGSGKKVRVTSALSFGKVLTDIDVTIDRRTGDAVEIAATNRVVTRDVAENQAVRAIVDGYTALSRPLADRVIGQITAPLPSTTAFPIGNSGLSTMGLVIADAQLAATRDPRRGGARVAFMNPGGVRQPGLGMAAGGADAGVEAGTNLMVTYGQAFTVQPFGNSLVVMTLSGSQIERLLEQQFVVNRVLQPSAGFTYAVTPSADAGSKVSDVRLDGVPIEPDAMYRVTVNSFLATGGDGFSVLQEGTERLGGAIDIDALADYLTANSPVAPPTLDRIRVQ